MVVLKRQRLSFLLVQLALSRELRWQLAEDVKQKKK
jgi:hypothetical protein